MSKVESWLAKLREVINGPYPSKREECGGWMRSATLETHLLATPRRKTALLCSKTGDYEIEEEMSPDVEAEMAVAIDDCYSILCEQMTKDYGPPLEIEPDDSSLQARVEPSEDGDYVDDEEETNSYLSGSYYDGSNDGEASFWLLGDDHLCIQKTKNWGDGDFQFYVIATVTPRQTT